MTSAAGMNTAAGVVAVAAATATAAFTAGDVRYRTGAVDEYIFGIDQPDAVFDDIPVCVCGNTDVFVFASHDCDNDAADGSASE